MKPYYEKDGIVIPAVCGKLSLWIKRNQGQSQDISNLRNTLPSGHVGGLTTTLGLEMV